ncbi:uncharacterized protein BXIN_1244 [Babesia sp. Xinjiang]|uniref:uncharacterized protein n=1 Tax=Babesia sp. Xinjiang TaxID=462227 RepID=UPI000A249CC6|nr:uncharacterized protein BXIN_1244 [Babesia sp. Xinjiang]ORM40003.1 hypothetical protein BXIN_1244 [Babesia sp. Xinjiang]
MRYCIAFASEGCIAKVCLVLLCLCTLCATYVGAVSVSIGAEYAQLYPHLPQAKTCGYNGHVNRPLAYIANCRHERNHNRISSDYKRNLLLNSEDEPVGYAEEEGFFRGLLRGRRLFRRGERIPSGMMHQEYKRIIPESDPWDEQDFGGIPNLPRRIPIELSNDPVNEEFIEMRKRQIPHSILKNYYMITTDEPGLVKDYGNTFKPLFEGPYEDTDLYLLGQGITTPFVYDDDEALESPAGGVSQHSDITRSSTSSLEEGEEPDEEIDENVRIARELWHTYNDKDRVCQLMLSSMSDYQDANLSPMAPDELPDDADFFDSHLGRYFITDSCGSPMWLTDWNEEYLRGLEGLEGKELIDYEKMWYERLDKLVERYDRLIPDDNPIKKVWEYFADVDSDEASLRQSGLRHRGPPRVIIGGKVLKTKWSEHIPPILLEYLTKHSSVSRLNNIKEKDQRQRSLDIKADAFRSCIDMSMNRLIKERKLRAEEEDRRKYIAFLHERRKHLGTSHIGAQPNTPYWLWEECWKNRDSLVPDTMLEILRGIRAVDPTTDITDLTKGTIESMKSPKLHGTKFDTRIYLDNLAADRTLRLGEYIDACKQEDRKAETDVANNGSSGEEHKEGYDEKIDGLPLPLPLGYYFRDVLSLDKFEEAFESFNEESFGTKEYCVNVGQLVKGTVEDVKPRRLLVDIHSGKFAVMYLNDHYSTPDDVPSGGFTAEFRKGDEMYFEVLSKYGSDIRVSTRRIQDMYKHRDIYRKHFKREIFKVRAIQRYTMGLLVQFQGDDIQDIKDYECPSDVHNLDNLAFIPYEELDQRYCSDVQRIRFDVVGKVIPVFIANWSICHGIPLLSNIEAIRRLPLAHIRRGDIICAKQCMYGKESVWLNMGHTLCTLSVMDMDPEAYEKHKRGDRGLVLAEVKNVHMLAGNVELTTKGIKTSSRGASVNEWMERIHLDPDPVRTFNERLRGDVNSAMTLTATEPMPSGTELNPIHNVPKMVLSTPSIPRLPPVKPDDGKGDWSGIRWDFTATASPHRDEDELQHGYNQYRWEVLTEQGWDIIPPGEQLILNRAKFQHDDVVYYEYEGRSYRADLLDMLRENLTDFIEQPLRNNCVVPLDDDELQEAMGLIRLNADAGTL